MDSPDCVFRDSPVCVFSEEGILVHSRSKRHSWHLVCLSSTSMAEGLSGRLYPRRRHSAPCRLTWQERQFLGTIIDVSYSGLALSLSGEAELSGEGEVLIQISTPIHDAVTLRAHPVYIHHQQGENKRVGFKLASIERGEEHWHTLCYAPHW
jgi:hypothetical protein